MAKALLIAALAAVVAVAGSHAQPGGRLTARLQGQAAALLPASSPGHHHHSARTTTRGSGLARGPTLQGPATSYTDCVNEWDRFPGKFQTLALNYGEDPVNDHTATCDMPVNKACVAIIKGDKMGCLMWQAVEEGCPGTAQDKPTCKAGYVYLGDNSNDAKHVILVAASPVRGLEDVHTPAVQKATGHLFASFWADSLPAVRKTGRNYDRGFDDVTTAALAINPPYFREFHQMHIHSGRRLPGIDKCIGSWAPGPLGVWQKPFLCSGLHPSQPQNQDDAVLFRTTVSSLDDIWTLYNSGIATPEMANTLAAAGGIPPNKAAYHVGMLVTQPPAWHKKKEFLVVLFAPSTKAAKNPDLGKLGRGQFMTNNVH